MTADQAKAAASQAILDGVQAITAQMANALSGAGEGGASSAEQFEAHLAHLRQMEATAHRIIDKAFDAKADEPEPALTEPDDDYRTRLLRTVGVESIHSGRLQTATGRALDDIGGHYGLKRK